METPQGARTGPFRLLVADHVRVSAPLDGDLDVAGFARVLPSLLERQDITVGFETERYTLSLNGLKAALLKMDDLQGRVGTRGALVRKGAHDERGVPDALPALHPHPAPNFALKSTDPALLKLVLPSLGADCNAPLKEGVDGADVAIHRVSDDQVIVLRECQRGAFQSAYAAWLVDDRPPCGQAPGVSPGRRLLAAAGHERAMGRRRRIAALHRQEPRGKRLRRRRLLYLDRARAGAVQRPVEPLCRGMLGGGMTVRTFAYELK